MCSDGSGEISTEELSGFLQKGNKNTGAEDEIKKQARILNVRKNVKVAFQR